MTLAIKVKKFSVFSLGGSNFIHYFCNYSVCMINIVYPDWSIEYYKTLLRDSVSVKIEDAVFRSEKAFCIANLKNHLPFWEHEVLKDHPHKQTLLKWIHGVQLEDFLSSFTSGEFQGIQLNSYYPEPMSLRTMFHSNSRTLWTLM